jgi:hypothetical protein
MEQQSSNQSKLSHDSVDSKQARTNKLKLRWGLVCLIGPTALGILALLLYAIINFIIGTTSHNVTDSVSTVSVTPIGQLVVNIILFMIGLLSVFTFLPGIIVGIVLLATRKS